MKDEPASLSLGLAVAAFSVVGAAHIAAVALTESFQALPATAVGYTSAWWFLTRWHARQARRRCVPLEAGTTSATG